MQNLTSIEEEGLFPDNAVTVLFLKKENQLQWNYIVVYYHKRRVRP